MSPQDSSWANGLDETFTSRSNGDGATGTSTTFVVDFSDEPNNGRVVPT